MPTLRFVRSLRWPPFVAAWAALAAGHAVILEVIPTHEWEAILRGAAMLGGALSLVLTSPARPRFARAVGASLALASLASAGGALGLEASRHAAPLEVHPRAVRAELFGFVADASRADQTPATLRLDVARVAVGTREATIAATVRLLWPSGTPAPTWAVAGTPIAARGLVRPLEDARNPGGSAPGRWLEREGIDATFDVEPGSVEPWTPPPGVGGKDRRGGARLAAEIRRSMGRLFDAHAPAAASALARGMLLGDRVGIDAETRDSFRNAGTLHILSISGLHVCIVAGFVAIAARSLRLGAVAGTAIEFGALAAYVLFVGAPPPALRSALLWVFARGARLVGRGAAPFAAWGAAGLILHLADPRLPLDLGFLLSFGAVLGLEAGAALAPRPRRDHAEAAWRRWALGALGAAVAGAGASLGTLPIETAAFGSIPIAGPIANLAVIPLTTLFLAEAILLAIVAPWAPPSVGDLLGGALGALGDLLLVVNDHLGGRVTPLAIHGAPPRAALAAAYLALLLVAALREGRRSEGDAAETRRLRVAALWTLSLAAAAIPILAAADPLRLSRSGPPRLVALDVGQGDAALLVGGRGEALVVDAGPRSERRDEGRLTVEPALRAEGVRRRVSLLASHGHRDHEGGIVGLASRGWIDRVIENGGGGSDRDTWRRLVTRRGGRDEIARGAARRLAIEAWEIAVHAPRAGRDPASVPAESLGGSANTAENDRSLLAIATPRTADRGASVLFPGDLEREGEEAWLEAGLDSVAVLKVPHHGSRTSSTEAWVSRLRPRLAIVSVGERNRHRHPSPETLRRYRRAGAWVVRTDREGAIRVVTTPDGTTLSTRAHPSPRPLDRAAPASLSRYIDFP
ncbi:MAG TPA: ComEC/Rec2 family competence protein [Candidatus Eisenbacteria bacterium]|nr:ComEC/Rec2 family competence protein [Candidatus Eisenbacteria bacterium]